MAPRPARALLAALLASAVCGCRPSGARGGVVVEHLEPGGSLARGGVRRGDRILAWRRASFTGLVESPFDLLEVESEQEPRGRIHLTVVRHGTPFDRQLPPGTWRGRMGPAFTGRDARSHRAARRLADGGRLVEAAAAWQALAAGLSAAGSPGEAAWVWMQAGEALSKAHRPEAREAYRQARAAAPRPVEQALVLHAEGEAAYYEASDHVAAERAYGEGLALREGLAPESLGAARMLSGLGRVVRTRGDLAGGEAHLERSLALKRRLAPESFEHVATLNALGDNAFRRGDLRQAEARFREALAIGTRLGGESWELFGTLSGLGSVARRRGDLATAERFYRRAAAHIERSDPGGRFVATSLNRLGLLQTDRGDYEQAADSYRRGLAISRARAPGSTNEAMLLTNSGLLAGLRGDWKAAREFQERSLAIHRRLDPESILASACLESLGDIQLSQGEPAAAEVLYRQALAITRKQAPGALPNASPLNSLGLALAERGDLRGAEAAFEEALALRRRFAPGTVAEAQSLHALGTLHARSGQHARALAFWRQAIAALEAQRQRLGESRGEGRFGARFASYYRDLIELLVSEGRTAEALHVLERSRARDLLAMLQARDLNLGQELPEALRREEQQADEQHERVQTQLAKLSGEAGVPEAASLNQRLRELTQRRGEIARRVQQVAPRLAALERPEPLALAGVRAALDPGTVLLAYSTGARRTLLFVVGAGTLEVFTLPLGEDELRRRVVFLRGLIEAGRPGGHPDPVLTEQAAALYRELVKPAERALGGARRVLISPDGPLHVLSFPALVRSQEPLEYFVEWRPLHTVASATVYAELRKARHAPRPAGHVTLAAFGDPRHAAALGRALAPLPASADEVRAIAALFPGSTSLHLGREASERSAKAVGRGPRYVHFACHTLLDRRFPLESALVLSTPDAPNDGQDDGLLQAWEILEQLRLDADLVTLSACESALGREVGGEGLIGLCRAFHYAGARSVLASQWAVSDRSTAALMERFYRGLNAGRGKDEALRDAQIEMIRGPEPGSRPVHWAAFQLTGDWR